MKNIIDKGAKIPKSKRIVFLGDSITDNGTYIAHLQMYFYRYLPDTRMELINLGVSSETACGLSEPDHPFPRPCVQDRIDRALSLSKPEWSVVCYGMNDGIYYPFGEDRFEAYKQGVLKIIEKVKACGSKVIVMTPPPFDKEMAKSLSGMGEEKYSYLSPYEDYDSVMERYGKWILTDLKNVADRVIDIYSPMKQHIVNERSKNPEYVSGDSIHPNIYGHWIMAKTLLRELFDICPENTPDYVYNPEASKLFSLVNERHRIMSSAWKEYVGHTNPNKAQALPIEEAKMEAASIEEKIKEYLLEI